LLLDDFKLAIVFIFELSVFREEGVFVDFFINGALITQCSIPSSFLGLYLFNSCSSYLPLANKATKVTTPTIIILSGMRQYRRLLVQLLVVVGCSQT